MRHLAHWLDSIHHIPNFNFPHSLASSSLLTHTYTPTHTHWRKIFILIQKFLCIFCKPIFPPFLSLDKKNKRLLLLNSIFRFLIDFLLPNLHQIVCSLSLEFQCFNRFQVQIPSIQVFFITNKLSPSINQSEIVRLIQSCSLYRNPCFKSTLTIMNISFIVITIISTHRASFNFFSLASQHFPVHSYTHSYKNVSLSFPSNIWISISSTYSQHSTYFPPFSASLSLPLSLPLSVYYVCLKQFLL